MLTQHDPYVILDLDNKEHNPATQDELVYFGQLIQAFNSYTELSRSGRGAHVVMRGHCDRNAKRGRIELYHDKRFMIFTGNVCAGYEHIQDRPEQIEALLESLPQTIDEQLRELPQTTQTKADQDVLTGMAACDIGDAIRALWLGQWASDYQSQSEADLALLGHLWWWSRDVDQTKRLFRLSELGKRPKAQRNDYYVDYSLRRIIANEPPPVDISQLKRPEPRAPEAVPEAVEAPVEVPVTITLKPKKSIAKYDASAYAPGFLGEVEKWLYSYAIRQNREVAKVTALGVFAGMCGRSWNVSRTGLNLYLLLLAETGSGKENIASGSEALFSALQGIVPAAADFQGPSMFASGQGLIRYLDKKPCFLSVVGEFGQFMNKLQAKNENAAMMKMSLLNLFNKSGAGDVLRPTVYSDADKNTLAVNAPSVTLVGESAPAPFLTHLSPELLEEGFVPRFLVVQSDAKREAENPHARQPMPAWMVTRLAEIATTALTLQSRNACLDVDYTPEAHAMLKTYNTHCDDRINHARSEAEKQIWTRAHLKSLRVAALLAVADKHEQPVIDEEHARWAIGLTRKDAEAMVFRFTVGDYGSGEPKQIVDLRRITEEFFSYTEDELVTKYGVPRGMLAAGFIPHCYFQRRTASLSAFRNTTKGATMALHTGLQSLVASGELVELNRMHGQPYNYFGKLYGRTAPPV